MDTQTGTVKWFNPVRGCGFITLDGGGKDVFANCSEITGGGPTSHTENQRVEFEVAEGRTGPRAFNIRSS